MDYIHCVKIVVELKVKNVVYKTDSENLLYCKKYYDENRERELQNS